MADIKAFAEQLVNLTVKEVNENQKYIKYDDHTFKVSVHVEKKMIV